jgi:peroxiredoxin
MVSFILPNVLERMIPAGDILAKGSMILRFYRGIWCPFSNLELRSLQQSFPGA